MIDPTLAFSLGNKIALLAWLTLAVSLFVPGMRDWTHRGAAYLIPALLAVAYIVLISSSFGRVEGGGFGSIAEVRVLFSNDAALAAGWLHYLAFDLFVGAWIARDGLARGVPRLLILPCLPLTLMFGPAGLLLYLVIRFALSARRQPMEMPA